MQDKTEKAIYPPTPECDRFLNVRERHDQVRDIINSRSSSTASYTRDNADYDREEHKAYQDCQMSAMAFFTATKSNKSTIRKKSVENDAAVSGIETSPR